MWILGYFLTHFLNKKLDPPTNKWVAVLPFRLISGDSSMEWLSDGFTEELTSSIAGISDLKVKSPTTMMQYKNSKKGIREISEELNVSNIIEGRLQQEGSSIIINASLINPSTEEILHNFKFKKDASEIKSIYSEVAQQVADMLNASITSDEKRRLEHVEKVDPDLYNLYLRGLSYAKQFTNQGLHAAIKIFDEAIKKDPNYAPVLAGKAFAIIGLAAWNASVNRDEAIKQTDPLIARSIAIDSNISLAYSASGWSEMVLKWDLKHSEIQFWKAHSLDPSDDVAICGLIHKNLYSGNPKAAYKIWETGKAISPKSFWIDGPHGRTLFFLGEIPEAIQFCQEAIEKYDHIGLYDNLGWIYDLANHYKEAIGILEVEFTKFGDRPASSLAWLASSYYKNGEKEKAAEILREMENLVNLNKPNVAIYTAAAYAAIGEKEKSLHFLDKANEMHDVDMVWLKMDPHFNSLHNEVRYQEMLRKVGF
jgi:TolB-like protein